jgi:hypothetical protein
VFGGRRSHHTHHTLTHTLTPHKTHTNSAQRNFRERQRARDATADARLADLASRIVSLEAEGAALRARARVLEAFVTLRAASPGSRGGGSGGSGEAAGDTAGYAPAAEPAPPPPPQPPVRGFAPVRAGTLAPPPPPPPQKANGSRPAAKAGSPTPSDAPLDWAAVAPLWERITARLRAALPTAAAPGTAAATATPTTSAASDESEVATLVQEASALLASVALAEGDAYGGYDTANGRGRGGAAATNAPANGGGSAHATHHHPPPIAAQLALADAIGLTPLQRSALVQARAAYLGAMAALVEGRAAAPAALHGLPEPTPWSGAPASRAFLHIAGAVEALGRHVRGARIAAATFTGRAWRDVLTPAQAGSLILMTAPARPCALALARALAVEAGCEEENGGGGGGGGTGRPVPAPATDGGEEEVQGGNGTSGSGRRPMAAGA